MIQVDPRLPSKPPQGYLTELINRLYLLFERHAREINHNAESLVVSSQYNTGSVDNIIAICGRPFTVSGVHGRVTVAGTDAGAVTATIRKVPSGTAIGSGTPVHQGTFNLKGAVNTVQELNLATALADLGLIENQALAVDFSGVLTDAVGTISILLKPA